MIEISVPDRQDGKPILVGSEDRHLSLRRYDFNPIVSKDRQYDVFEDVKKAVYILSACLLSF